MNRWSFHQVWAVDFEFMAPPGGRPDPVCMVARELKSDTLIRLWRDDLRNRRRPPFSTAHDTLVVAYYASAEISCFLELGWPVPERVLDLYAEFRVRTNGTRPPCGSGLVGAMAAFGLGGMGAIEKDSMRQLVLRGEPWSETERRDILDYCESDVDALTKLLPVMAPDIDLARALLRGRYTAAVARIEHTGVPIDVELHAEMVRGWASIKGRLIAEVDKDYGVYEGTTFKHDKFADYLTSRNIPWPRLDDARLDLKAETFREAAKSHPEIAPLHELRTSLSQLRLNELHVGPDGRNRTSLWAFGAASGRNTPSNTKFIFGPSVWLRGLIRPSPGRAIAHVDWSQQEFGIAAALSGDGNMIAAYQSGDPYLAFAKHAGAVPPDATRQSHGPQRELYKICALAVQFGMGEKSLSQLIGQPEIVARSLLRHHRQVFPDYWRWSDGAANHFNLLGEIHTVFGWRMQNGIGKSDRTARNFPMQANGAEMMRLAACLMTEGGIEVCAPVHDAFLVGADTGDIANAVRATEQYMASASRTVLSGFELRADATVYAYPARYADPRGVRMFELVGRLLAECGPKQDVHVCNNSEHPRDSIVYGRTSVPFI